MTPAKIKKEVQRQAVLFEESVKAGECDGKRIKFEKFAEQWLKDYAEVELAPKTVYDYRKLLPSINAHIGHILRRWTPPSSQNRPKPMTARANG